MPRRAASSSALTRARKPARRSPAFRSAARSAANYGRYTDRTLDDLYDKQARENDPEKRKQLVWQFERRALDEQAYAALTPWWQRIVPHSSKMKGWKIGPSHYINQDLSDIWLSKQ